MDDFEQPNLRVSDWPLCQRSNLLPEYWSRLFILIGLFWCLLINLLQNRHLKHWDMCCGKVPTKSHIYIPWISFVSKNNWLDDFFAWNQGNLTIREAQLHYCKAIWFLSLSNGFPTCDTVQYRLVKLYEALEIQVLYVLFMPYVPQAPCLEIWPAQHKKPLIK